MRSTRGPAKSEKFGRALIEKSKEKSTTLRPEVLRLACKAALSEDKIRRADVVREKKEADQAAGKRVS